MAPKWLLPPIPMKLWRGFWKPHHNLELMIDFSTWLAFAKFVEWIVTGFLETQSHNHLNFWLAPNQIHIGICDWFSPCFDIHVLNDHASQNPLGEEGSALLHRGLWKCWLQLRQKIFPKTANIKQKLMPFFVQLRLFLQGGLVAKRSRLLWSKFMMIFWQD